MSVTSVLKSLPGESPTPEPTPVDPTSAANVPLSEFYLAAVMGPLVLIASIVVVAIALRFAYRYHSKLLDVVKTAVLHGQVVGASNDDSVHGASAQSSAPEIVGPSAGAPSEKLAFVVNRLDPTIPIDWTAETGTPSSISGPNFVTSFAEAKTHTVLASYTDAQNRSHELRKEVTVGVSAPSASPAAPITLPFVVKNWGRLVIVTFGVGIVAMLMVTRILDPAAGVGVLGTLLGVGAASATPAVGGSGGAAATSQQPSAPQPPKAPEG